MKLLGNRAVDWFSGAKWSARPSKRKGPQALHFLDGFLEGRLSKVGSVGLVQCGANDGVTVDPVRSFILRNPMSVRAVLVEPLPDVYASLQANYSTQDHVKTLNIAVGPEEEIELFRIKPEYDSAYKGIIASGITSFDREFVLRKAKRQLNAWGVPASDRIESFRQSCQTVSQIVDSFAIFLGDELFIQIDTEGFDDEVVYSIDFQRHQPFAINYEMQNLSEGKLAKLRDFLSQEGYRVVQWSKSDEIAIRYNTID